MANGFDASLVEEVVADMADMDFWESAGASQHLVAAVRDWFKHTWASFEGSVDVLNLSTGCSAGNPCADIFFALAFSKVSVAIRVLLREKGYCIDYDTAGVAAFFFTLMEMCQPALLKDKIRGASMCWRCQSSGPFSGMPKLRAARGAKPRW